MAPNWFNKATNYYTATKDALRRRREVLHSLEEPSIWELDSSRHFSDTMKIDERWQKTCEMRAVALVAARAGDDESFQSAIKMIRMSMDPAHLQSRFMSRSVSGLGTAAVAANRFSRSRRQSSVDHGNGASLPVETYWRDMDLRQAIEYEMDDVRNRPRESVFFRSHRTPPHILLCVLLDWMCALPRRRSPKLF